MITKDTKHKTSKYPIQIQKSIKDKQFPQPKARRKVKFVVGHIRQWLAHYTLIF